MYITAATTLHLCAQYSRLRPPNGLPLSNPQRSVVCPKILATLVCLPLLPNRLGFSQTRQVISWGGK